MQGGYLFKDKYQRTVMLEVKRGILNREASGQIIEYYGLLKQENPNEIVELVLCANVIPSERKMFLERVGIECKEIGVSLITDLAKEFQYKFLDEIKEENTPKNATHQIVQTEAIDIKNQGGVWIFQANPERYDILNSLADPELTLQGWTVNPQFKYKIHNGDIALIWMSGKDAGIYAVADIVSDPKMMKDSPEDDKYWIKEEERGLEKLRVSIEIIKDMRNKPVYKRDLKNIPGLKNLSILSGFLQRTNFPVTQEEWGVIFPRKSGHNEEMVLV